MGKQGKRRRLGKQDRGIAPQALFKFALMMGAYFPCVMAIISLFLTHIHSYTLSASHSNISSPSALLHFCYIFLLSLFSASYRCLKQSVVSHLHQHLFLCPACVRLHMDVSLQVQGTHLHRRIFILTLASSHLKVCSFNIFIQTDMNAYQASKCLAFFKSLRHHLFFIFLTTYSTSASLSVGTELTCPPSPALQSYFTGPLPRVTLEVLHLSHHP